MFLTARDALPPPSGLEYGVQTLVNRTFFNPLICKFHIISKTKTHFVNDTQTTILC